MKITFASLFACVAVVVSSTAASSDATTPELFRVALETSKGKIVLEVHRDWSPHGADRFFNLVRAGYYDGCRFSRVIEGKWAQFGINGDPKISKAWRNQTIPDDPRIVSNTRGTVAFAFAVANGRTTQVFINLRDNSSTHDTEPFVPFGKIIEGMDVADRLNAEYGEDSGSGIRSGKQEPLFAEGNAYLKKNFPRLDYIQAASINSDLFFQSIPVELKVSEISDRTVRVELAPIENNKSETPSLFLASFPVHEKFRTRQLSSKKDIRIGGFHVTIQPQPLLVTVRRADGSLVQELAFNASEGTNSISFQTAATVLGLGEGGDQFDRRGYNFPLINGQRYKLAELGTRVFSPFLVGSDGWALFMNAPSGGIDLRGEQGVLKAQPSAPKGMADVFVTDAREPADAMREFIRLTGAPVMPPKWALGYMQSRRTLSTEADLLAEAKRFRDDQLPCDTFIMLGTGFCPAGWNFGHDSFLFNTNVFTREAPAVIHDLHTNHLHVVLHVVPLQRDYPSLHGTIPPAPGEELDKTHIANYWKRHHDLVQAGVDGWWPDEGDWFDVPSRIDRHRMYYEGPLNDTPNVRPWNLQRNGAPGIARYGGWHWSGDILSSWKTFAAQVKVGQNSSLSVSPFWGTDIGGFYPATNREYTGELYARWFQFSAFCPSFRSHGRTWWLHRPWGWNTGETGPIESRPPPDPSELHNAEVEPICQKYLNLRYQLMPYTYTLTRQAHDDGMPMMRALWLHYPKDAEAVKLGDEFLWGRDLLIAPVTEKTAASRKIYLPEGEWFDWWTGEKKSGRQWIDRNVDLATMPIYARAGAIIPFDPVRQYVSQPVSEPTTIKIFPGADGEFTLYDDDGESLSYRGASDPKATWLHMKWNDRVRKLTVEPDQRMKKWSGEPRKFKVVVIGKSEPSEVIFRGKKTVLDL